MRIQYEISPKQLAESQMLLLQRSKTARRWKWQGVIATALMSGVPLFLLIKDTNQVRLVFGSIAALVGGIVYLFIYPSLTKGRIEKLVKEQLGSNDSVQFELEISESGIWTKDLSVN